MTKTITNCAYYGTATTCFACNDGYHLSDDNLTCTQIKNECLTYTEYKCDTCALGYVKDKTTYQEEHYKFNNNTQRDALLELLHLNVMKYSIVKNLNVCREATVKFCS